MQLSLRIDSHHWFCAVLLFITCCFRLVPPMDLFTHLNYCYPGSPNDTRLHVSQQSQGSPPRVAQNIQPIQNQTHPGHECSDSDSSKATLAHVSLNSTVGHDVYVQPTINPTGLRDPICPTPTDPIKSYYYVGESADLSDQYIPSSSDKITCTDHRPLDDIFGNARHSSGWQHPKSDLAQSLHIGASRGHFAPLLTYPLPLRPHMHGKMQVPLLAVNNQIKGTGLVVEFSDCNFITGQWMEGMLFYIQLASCTIPEDFLRHINVENLAWRRIYPQESQRACA